MNYYKRITRTIEDTEIIVEILHIDGNFAIDITKFIRYEEGYLYSFKRIIESEEENLEYNESPMIIKESERTSSMYWPNQIKSWDLLNKYTAYEDECSEFPEPNVLVYTMHFN